MLKIPQNLKFTQANNSDLFGNIHYTKSINFDEAGYLKLSSRSVSIANQKDISDFNIPLSFGRNTIEGYFYIPTAGKNYVLSLTDGITSISTDSGTSAPVLNYISYGAWWQNRWHVTANTKLWYKTISNGNWTDTTITITTGIPHPICVFEKANTLLVGNGNLVQQLNTSYATTSLAQLTIPADCQIVGISYNNNMAGLITRPSDTAEGQNKEASFYTWDGSASSPNAVYGLGSDAAIAIVSYRSSFVILTRAGELKYFNGGGFDTLASFPVYFNTTIWGNTLNQPGYGDMMKVDGEIIYINTNSAVLDTKLNTYMENQLGGLWCYDPTVGLYHRQSPSVSKITVLACRNSDVSITDNKITVYNITSYPTSPTIPATGNPVKALTTNIGGLTQGNIYYIIKSSSTEFKLATTKQNALDSVEIDLTSTGSDSYFMALDLKDFGASKVARPGGISLMGYITNAYDNLIFGGEYYDTNSIDDYAHLNISIAGFKNIGYLVTPKIPSQEIEDNIQKLYIKYRALKTEDKIKVKYKNKDTIGLPEYAFCTATSTTIITTTGNIQYSYGTTGELECEIISGAGAGQMVKVTSISYDTGTYTIILSEALEGVVASDTMTIKLDNWIELGTVTSADDNNWIQFPLAKTSKWTKFKVVLEGSNTTIEELQIINSKHQSSV